MKFVDRLAKFRTDLSIFFGCEQPMFIFTKVIAIETGLKCEGMSYHELFPSNHTTSTQLIWLNLESAISIVEKMSLFCKYSRKKSHNSPAEETTISGCVATIEKTVFLL
jgi:hypothetical protein